MVGSEAYPFVKTGGLADVLGALPPALARQRVRAACVLPRYGSVPLDGARKIYDGLAVYLPAGTFRVDLWAAEWQGVTYYLADCPPLFGRSGLYHDRHGEFGDNHLRFAVLAGATFGVIRHFFRPDVIHCHDWQAGLVPLYLKYVYASDPTFYGIKTLFTIHNLGYQGKFPRNKLWEIGLNDTFWNPGGIEFHGEGSLMKAGLVWSDRLTTVSPAYAREIQTPEFGFGMDGILRGRRHDLYGILNGVDYSKWNPETDTRIAANYSADDLTGKQACKVDLLRAFGLPEERADKPVVGIVSRLAYQKGFDLLEPILWSMLEEDITLIVLGTGEHRYEHLFGHAAWVRPDKVACRLAYDDTLAHKIEAGADLFLMPSRYEPCGLNQIYSLKYGTLPIVRATGGLDDTIDGDTGFKFWGYNPWDLLASVRYAIHQWWEYKPNWQKMMRTAMKKDFSWDTAAAHYRNLYQRS